MKKVIEHFDKQSKFSLLIRSYISVLLIFLMDLATGSELSLIVLYMFPISITSWFVNRKHGLIISTFCSLINFFHSQLPLQTHNFLTFPDIVPIWNLIQLLVIFLAFGYMISTLKSFQIAKSNNEIILAKKSTKFSIATIKAKYEKSSIHWI